MAERKRIHIRVVGTVQGVGFRFFTQHQARRLGLCGYVRNLPGGDVEVEAEGAEEELSALLEVVRRGPSGARVRDVAHHFRPALGTETDFEIRH